ncbi:RDD family protein [Candidatus Nitrosarchaeum limnium]|uniref:RDD family protein n=1 Tax=Candidatus Nitrosarchaeum limnium BG20 TaxID=859192 RepID=S2EI61_9ARCH|nr:RDD family protein [Candidatus Nitrosarchaeum limnium]EPA04447.1 RDD family protein [Candidatus Nitrosarchaeum limnium BG20]
MSESNKSPEVIIAKWSERFFAWLIDFVIISVISTIAISSIFGSIDYDFNEKFFWAEMTQFIPTSVIFFGYWVILEYLKGQTIGKKILNLKITNMYGKKPDLKGILISSFGKTFLLPIDVGLGWIFTNEMRQRIFNKIGDTIIIKIKEQDQNTDNIKYKKD